jgi:hypothetical protein
MSLHFAPIACASPGGTRIPSIEPVSVCQNTGRSILARRVSRRHPFCVIGPARRTNHARRVMTTGSDGTGGCFGMILSRSLPATGRAGLGSTGLVRPPVPDRCGRRRQPLRRRCRRPGFTACAGNQRGAEAHRLSAGWLNRKIALSPGHTSRRKIRTQVPSPWASLAVRPGARRGGRACVSVPFSSLPDGGRQGRNESQIYEADGCCRIILTVGSHRRNHAE